MGVWVSSAFRRALKSPWLRLSAQLSGGVSGQSTPLLLVSGTFDFPSVSSPVPCVFFSGFLSDCYGFSISETSFCVTTSGCLPLLALGALCPQGS